MTKPWQPQAHHILDCIAKIRRIQSRGELIADEVLFDATLRNLQTLSEATQQLPEDLKQGYPTIPWKEFVVISPAFFLSSLLFVTPCLRERQAFGLAAR